MHLRFRRVEGQQLLTKWSERDLSLMNVQVFLLRRRIVFWQFCSWLSLSGCDSWWQKFEQISSFCRFDHFWHTEEIFEEICQCGQVSMYILSIINCASVDGRSINNYSESFPMIDDRRAKNALFLFLMPSLPGHHTTSLRGKFSSHRSIDTDDDCFLPFDTDGVLRRLAAKMGRFLWSIPSVKKARQKACHVTIARSAPRLSRFFGLFALRRLQRRELEI